MDLNINSIYNTILADIQTKLPVSFDVTLYPKKTFKSVLDETIKAPDADKTNFTELFSEYVKQINHPSYKYTSSETEEITNAIKKASNLFGVDENLIRAVIKQESNFSQYSVSKSGAMGLMQLMPKTAEMLGVINPYDIEQNVIGGTKYLSQMLDKFGGNISYALAAYNAGPGSVTKYGGIPPYEETQNYVPLVLSYYNTLSLFATE